MVLFDVTDINTGFTSTTILRHKRIKILNDAGKDDASISIEYVSIHGIENVADIEAETINLDNSKIQYTRVEDNVIYHQTVDRYTRKITFTFPQVKAGSIIEYSYKIIIGFGGGFPDWEFQVRSACVRYCELKAAIRNDYAYKMTARVYQPYVQNKTEAWIKGSSDTIGYKYVWALKNVNSYHEEAFSTDAKDDVLKNLDLDWTGYKYNVKSELKSLESSWFAVT